MDIGHISIGIDDVNGEQNHMPPIRPFLFHFNRLVTTCVLLGVSSNDASALHDTHLQEFINNASDITISHILLENEFFFIFVRQYFWLSCSHLNVLRVVSD